MENNVKNCTECGNVERCLDKIAAGTVVFCGSSMCKPIKKGSAKNGV